MYNPLTDALCKIRITLQIISCVYDFVDELILSVDIDFVSGARNVRLSMLLNDKEILLDILLFNKNSLI